MNLFNTKKCVLFLGAHPDDEIGCGATLHKLLREGHEVHYAYMSPCTQSTIALGFEADKLIEECKASCLNLGIKSSNILEYDFPVRKLPEHRQEILETLVHLRKELDPGLVLVASRNDIHQDHATVSAEAIRAFKHASIIGYEFPWNQLESRIDLIVAVKEEDINAKIRSWQCYKTQSSRNYHGEELLKSLAKIRGLQANVEYAESFEVIRLVV